ncbi:N-formylglutamate amidohydrolase [Allopontixanthobacter sediminis]|uniref:N-formylglutamate amidohydrolase n=1 Tax=Allopontixanthobacter sediminis TaxID=1689985 RepID=A0A845BDN5_9SPHN|nr:N-formylglutamate amidohydrolase [Allopontixanthobacter sediminis]MXP45679.1 N-formylglutamate amidohydrolase [Allopontixanthobacter sediminis]
MEHILTDEGRSAAEDQSISAATMHSAKSDLAWDMIAQPGPVMITAIHAGHTIRDSLLPWLEIDDQARLREEDPLTDFFLPAGDTIFRANRSRFEFDLNRPANKAMSVDPKDTWGLKVWERDLPQEEIDASLALHEQFYRLMAERAEAMIAEHGQILVLDIHSYNHRRGGPNEPADKQEDSPDIDLGATTLDKSVFGGLLDEFAEGLRSRPVRGKSPDVRVNVRWEDGGNFPEWLYARYGDAACVITLEYKKIFMDEWSHSADIAALQELREGFIEAVSRARRWLARPAGAR